MISKFTKYLERKKSYEIEKNKSYEYSIKVLKHFIPVLKSCSHHEKFTARITKKAKNDFYHTYYDISKYSRKISLSGFYEDRKRDEFYIYFDGSVIDLINKCEQQIKNYERSLNESSLTAKKYFDKIERFLCDVYKLCKDDKELEEIIIYTTWSKIH